MENEKDPIFEVVSSGVGMNIPKPILLLLFILK